MIRCSNSKSGIKRLFRFTQTSQLTFDSQCPESKQVTEWWTTKFAFSTHSGQCRRTVLSRYDCETKLPYTMCYRNASKIGLNPTHYEVLGLQKDASADDIRSAFLQKSKESHPDLNSKNPNNHTQFVSVNEAYSVLSKPMERRDYDIFLNHQEVLKNSPHTHTMANDHYYHHPKGSYDEQLYSMRDKSKDEYYKSQPYYGIRGVQKISNLKIIAVCLIFMFGGIIFHVFVVRRSSAKHIKNLDERDKKAHKLWMNAKKEGEANAAKTREQELEFWQKRQEEELRKRQSK